ncbi:hypothetical protein PO909_010390 [Leuciscus waleckii]
MAGQDTGQILKYFAGIMAFLLTHGCVGQTLFPKTSTDFQFYSSDTEGQLHYISTEPLEYIVVVELNASHAILIEQIREALAFNVYPFQLDNRTEITAANITTVCQPNVTGYQCVCEDGYAWTYNNCRTYEACDDISLGSCGCISGIPSDGDICVLESELPFTDFLYEIEMESSSISVIDEMRRYFQNITFPLQLDELVEVLDVDITTVCNFSDSGYKCVCEDQYFWPCEKCTEYGSCDDITNNTCSCINDIPSDRQFCQPVNEITNITACAQPTVTPVLTEYQTEIQIDAENTAIIDQLMNYWMSFDFPYIISDSTNITEINITTVCSLNETQYRCKCEGLFVWPNDTCHLYKACDDIIDGSCTCINALPINGQFCQLKEVPTVTPPSTRPISTPSSTSIPSTLSPTSMPPSSTSTPPSSTPPSSTSMPPSSTSMPPSTPPATPSSTSIPSTLSPTSTSMPPSSTSTPPSSTSMPPSTPPAIPSSTSIPSTLSPTSTSMPPSSSTPPSSTSTSTPPSSTSMPPSSTSMPPSTPPATPSSTSIPSTLSPTSTSMPPSSTSTPPSSTSTPPSSTSMPPSSTSMPPSTPPATPSSTSIPSTLSPTSTSMPPSSTSMPPSSTSTPPSPPSSTSTSPSSTSMPPSSTPPSSTSTSMPPSTPPATPSSTPPPSTSMPPSSTPPSTPTSTPPSTPPSTSMPPSSTPPLTTSQTPASPSSTSTPPSTPTPSLTSTLSPTSKSKSTSMLSSSTPPSKPSSTSTPPSTPSSTSNLSPTLASTLSSTSMPPSSTSPSTQSPPPTTTTVIRMSVTLNKTFDSNLTDPENKNYKDLSGKIETAIDKSYSKKLTGYIPASTKVYRFRPGSVIADYTISATSNNLDFRAANTDVNASLELQGISLVEDAFARSEQNAPKELYPLQKLELNCAKNGTITWMVNNKDISLDKTKYNISNNNSTLTVINTNEDDSGRYSCIQNSALPYIEWQNIVIKQSPNINVGEKFQYFPCEDSTVKLRCSVDAGYGIEWVQNSKVQGSDITVDYATQKGKCKEETFTCRLKGLPQLLQYSYSRSRVTVTTTSTEDYDCFDDKLGFGKENNEKKGICENGMKGNKTYRCESTKWKNVQDNCVLNDIAEIKSNITALIVGDIPIPEFMEKLSSVTTVKRDEIRQSPATVQAIVDILVIVANLSQTIFINEPEMVNFLKTVDIIVSGNITGTWKKLKKETPQKIPAFDFWTLLRR